MKNNEVEENEIENFGSRSDFSEAFAIATQLIVADSLRLKNAIIRDYNNFYCDALYSLKIALYIEEHQKELTETMLKEKSFTLVTYQKPNRIKEMYED